MRSAAHGRRRVRPWPLRELRAVALEVSSSNTLFSTILFGNQDEAGPLYPYMMVCPGQLSEIFIFSPLSSEEGKLYKLPHNNFSPSRRRSERELASSPSLKLYNSLPYKRRKGSLKCSAMKAHRSRSEFGTPPEALPHRSDQVCCSNWNSAGEFVERSGLPVERFEWSREMNEDTGEWWIHGQASPTFTERLTGKWLWLKMKLTLLLRRVRNNRW